jgi:alpha-mannosidase
MRNIALILFIFLLPLKIFSQQAYFADGYHGGIYGHYPIWKTQFIVDKLAQHPEWKISLEIEPETWDTVQAKTPEAYTNLKNIITDKRIEFTNPTYAQPYCYNISGESLIRQFEYGIKKIHSHFPDVTFTTYSAEEPCFTSSLPQILKLFGFKYAVLKCPDTCWGGYTAAYGGELVNWIGPDKTSILTVPRYACEELERNSTWQTKAWNNSKDYLDACFAYGIKNPAGMCFQDAGWKNGPWIGNGNNIKNNSTYITWKDYIENISVGKTNDDYHFTQEDMRVSLMWGSQVLQRIAQEVRSAENNIVMAEKIGTMANIENGYILPQNKIDEGWRTLMMAQHHDSWIVPYNRLNKNRTWAQEITLWTNNTNNISQEITNTAIQSIGYNNIGANNLGYIQVYNTLGFSREELVKVAIPKDYANQEITVFNAQNKEVKSLVESEGDSYRLVFRAEVPSFGFATYRLDPKRTKQTQLSGVKVNNNECVLENDMYKITLDLNKGGMIKSLIAKNIDHKEFAAQSNQFALNELRGYFYEDEKFYSSTESPAQVSILKDNQFETSVKIEGQIAFQPYIQTITLTKGEEKIDFDLTINWKNNVGIGEYKQLGEKWRENRRGFYDDRYKLNILFPANLKTPELYKNAPFDVCKSELEDTHFNTWDNIKHNIILHWVDLTEKDSKYGLTLLSDHTTSYSYGKEFPLALTAQYSGIGLWGPDYKITRPLKMKYAIIPHKGKWDSANIASQSNTWNEPLVCAYHPSVKAEDKSYINADNTGYEITAVKTEGNAILVRLFNAEGNDKAQKITFGFPVSDITEVDLNSKVIAKQTINKSGDKSSISVSIPRFGIKTYLINKN